MTIVPLQARRLAMNAGLTRLLLLAILRLQKKIAAADAKILEAHHVQTSHVRCFSWRKAEFSVFCSLMPRTRLWSFILRSLLPKQLVQVFKSFDDRIKLEER